MKLILPLILLITTLCSYSQPITYGLSYNTRMESISMNHLDLSLKAIRTKSHILIIRPLHRIKFTFKTGFNKSILNKVNIEADNVEDMLQDVTVDDYISLIKYDIRCKVYITKNIRILFMSMINGLEFNTNVYSSGLLIRF